ncbi:hypothetical protein BOO69_04345 [Sulfitobacter alexandrii]|uniref:SnoaL-like domain-containing protein n=1 Tax=Sulfitobacter alexandrii TaxID=1917485 RepID=A0A1J0WEJ2_9RHOB|nr:hypothetical protein [Sulfitobacter alexandrii]APE42737.1 hypothetical protein BOO69_04345 [Sulfitobacter alexandrii]
MLNLQAFMDKVIGIIREDDADGYLSMIELPYQVITARETRTFVRRQDMREHFHLFRIGLHQLGFHDLSHRVTATTMLGADLATGIYETQLYRNDQLFIAPYRSCITLRRSGRVWRAVSTAHTIGHADWMDRMDAITGMQKTD